MNRSTFARWAVLAAHWIEQEFAYDGGVRYIEPLGFSAGEAGLHQTHARGWNPRPLMAQQHQNGCT